MKTATDFITLVIITFLVSSLNVKSADSQQEDLRAGKNFIETHVYTQDDDERILKLFEGLRVADVCDGMDAIGLKDIGSMSPEIHPLWRDTSNFTHRIVGIAVTARYVPTRQPFPSNLTTDEYDKWAAEWYKNRSSEPFTQIIRKGTVVVIEEAPDTDVGSIGSNNILSWKLRGCVGVVTSGTARDTDEIILEKVPLYFKKPGRGIRPGRNEIESVNRPIVCGGVTVMPGDIIVADGDGVIVVPREHAEKVANYARKILEGDKAARRNLYQKLGIPMDNSVK